MKLPPPFDGKSKEYITWSTQRLVTATNASPTHFYKLDCSNETTLNNQTDVLARLCQDVEQQGYAFYQLTDAPKIADDDIRQRLALLHQFLGLSDADTGVIAGEDKLSLLQNSPDADKRRFVPYSDRAMNWHTDGYYNAPESSVKAFCLHCIKPAASGGELTLFDDQLLLIALYEHNPDAVTLLTHEQAMLVPESRDELGHARPDRQSAVFEVVDGSLLTRFTTRKRNIQWRTPSTKAAIEFATALINEQTQWQKKIRLLAGQGVITRNVLHCRSAFEDGGDDTGRKMLRGRYSESPNVIRATQTTTNR